MNKFLFLDEFQRFFCSFLFFVKFFNKLFNLNDELLNDNDKKLYTVIEMTENDKKLMECFNFLMNHPDLELNRVQEENLLKNFFNLLKYISINLNSKGLYGLASVLNI